MSDPGPPYALGRTIAVGTDTLVLRTHFAGTAQNWPVPTNLLVTFAEASRMLVVSAQKGDVDERLAP